MALANKHRLPVAQQNPGSVVVESYRTLSANLQFSSEVGNCLSVLVTSSASGEGRTITAANLAVVSAQGGKRVLLVDADLRNPTLHLQFRLPNVTGLSTMVRSSTLDDHAILQTATDGLYLLPSGPQPGNPLEILSSSDFEQIVSEAQTEFDMIVFDSPPVLAVTDALLLSRVVNGILLVVNTRKTQRSMVQKTIQSIQQVNGNLLGCVLNRTNKVGDRHSYLRHSALNKEEWRGTKPPTGGPNASLSNQPTTNM